MKIAIFSDTHDYMPHIDVVLEYCHTNDIDRIIHCGDVCKIETLDHMVQKWKKPFDFVFGNGDLGRIEMKYCAKIFEHVTCHGEEGYLELSVAEQGYPVYIGFVHYPQVAYEMAYQHEGLDFIFYGHTHKPWLELRNNTIIANPGPLTGMIYETSFAVLDIETKDVRLLLLKDMI